MAHAAAHAVHQLAHHGLRSPLLLTLGITALAAARHIRLALSLQPVEALG